MNRKRPNKRKNQSKSKPKDLFEETDRQYQECEDYEVEAILKKRINKDESVEYFIKWENYPDDDNQWIRQEGLFCDDLLEKFENECSKDLSLVEDLRDRLPRRNSRSRSGSRNGIKKQNTKTSRIENEDSEEHNYTLDSIIGLRYEQDDDSHDVQKKIKFLIKWKESKKATYESLDIVRKKYPDELITFLVGQIIFLDE